MKLRTEIAPLRPAFQLLCNDMPLMLGSCFTDYVGTRFRETLRPVCINPCGTLFNPAGIARIVSMALDGEIPRPRLFGQRWLTPLLPTRFSSADEASANQLIAEAMESLSKGLRNMRALILTFGTARVYEMDGKIVNNCHKLPERLFTRRLLTVDEITEEWGALLNRLRDLCPGLKTILTVSPVRHVRDTLHGNTLSKATLHLAIEQLVNASPDDTVYFPAYEILTDDLRDYRFYADDLVHPSGMAVDYIWELFGRSFFTPADMEADKEGLSLTRRIAHHPINASAEEQMLFHRKTTEMVTAYIAANPGRTAPAVS